MVTTKRRMISPIVRFVFLVETGHYLRHDEVLGYSSVSNCYTNVSVKTMAPDQSFRHGIVCWSGAKAAVSFFFKLLCTAIGVFQKVFSIINRATGT